MIFQKKFRDWNKGAGKKITKNPSSRGEKTFLGKTKNPTGAPFLGAKFFFFFQGLVTIFLKHFGRLYPFFRVKPPSLFFSAPLLGNFKASNHFFLFFTFGAGKKGGGLFLFKQKELLFFHHLIKKIFGLPVFGLKFVLTKFFFPKKKYFPGKKPI